MFNLVFAFGLVVLENVALKHQLNHMRTELKKRREQINNLLSHVEMKMVKF